MGDDIRPARDPETGRHGRSRARRRAGASPAGPATALAARGGRCARRLARGMPATAGGRARPRAGPGARRRLTDAGAADVGVPGHRTRPPDGGQRCQHRDPARDGSVGGAVERARPAWPGAGLYCGARRLRRAGAALAERAAGGRDGCGRPARRCHRPPRPRLAGGVRRSARPRRRRPVPRPVTGLRDVGAGHRGDRHRRTWVDRTAQPDTAPAARRGDRRTGGGAARLHARHRGDVRAADAVRRPGQPARGACGRPGHPGRHRLCARRPRCARPRLGDGLGRRAPGGLAGTGRPDRRAAARGRADLAHRRPGSGHARGHHRGSDRRGVGREQVGAPCHPWPVPGVTLVVGDEEFLVARAVQRAVNAIVGDGDPAGVHDVAAVDLAAEELLELTSPSLFGEARIVVVRSAQDASKDLGAALASLAESGDDSIGLVVAHAGGSKGKALLESLKGAGARVVDVPRVRTQRDREQFVAEEVAAAGGSIDRDAAADLVASIGTDLRELATACTQLVADCGQRVHADNVAAYYRGRAESTGFAVADRAVEGDVAAALETLRWAFATGVDPVLISAALASNLRTLGLVASAGRGSPDALAGQLGLPAWKIRRAQGWLKRWRPEALADAVAAVAAADAGIKGEGADAAYAAERAVITVAGCATGR